MPRRTSFCFLLFLPSLLNAQTLDESKHNHSLRRRTNHKRPRNLIVGGADADEGDYPYYTRSFFCGATLIHDDIVLTAAHCNRPPTTVTVGGKKGYFQSFFTGNAHGVDRTVQSVVRHPDYKSDIPGEYDVMIMKLSEPVLDVTPVKLNRDNTFPYGNQEATIIGHGMTGSSFLPFFSPLQEADLNVRSIFDCQSSYGSFYDHKMHLCAGGDGVAACKGDSGGPILTKDWDGNVVQAGILSFGRTHDEDCGDVPMVYTRTSSVIDWIEEQICLLSSNPSPYCGHNDKPGAPSSAPGSEPISDFLEGSLPPTTSMPSLQPTLFFWE